MFVSGWPCRGTSHRPAHAVHCTRTSAASSCSRQAAVGVRGGVQFVSPPATPVHLLQSGRHHGDALSLTLPRKARPGARQPHTVAPPRCGGGPRKWDVITCCDCQRRFRRQVSDAQWYQQKGLTPAIRCKDCRTYRMTARVAGDDPDALFPVAQSAVEYRMLRNRYMEAKSHIIEELGAKRRAVKAARVLLAGGKTAYRRQGRVETTKARRQAVRDSRKKEAERPQAGPPASSSPAPRRAQHMPATPEQRLGRED